MANEMGYNAGNTQGKDQIKPEVANNPSIFPPADYMPKLIQPSSYTNEAREAMASAYNAFKRGK
jgi:putrescine transport system substrate-binding protein